MSEASLGLTDTYLIYIKSHRLLKKISMEIDYLKKMPIIQQLLKKRQAMKGAISGVGWDQLIGYLSFLTVRRSSTLSQKVWLDSIKKFKRTIQEDPILRMHWEYGIYKCNKTLNGLTGDDVLDLINTSCKTPPAYSNEQLVGFPINSIFIEFMQNENGRAFFANEKVNTALKAILDDYNKMLSSQESLEHMNEESPNGWFCPQARKKIDYSLYICDPTKPHYGFQHWNEWFLRQFQVGARPIGLGSPVGVHHDNIIVNACESTPLIYPLQPQLNVRKTNKFWLKDDIYSLTDMFGAVKHHKEALALHFVGGTVYQAFLSALFYHRWNSPVDGVIEDIYDIPGTYYLDQSQFIPFDEGSPNNSQSFLTAVSTRKVVVLNASNPRIGKIAMVFIGMAEVSSCVTTVNVGDHVQKGQEIGHFEFGGSSHAIVFEKKAKLRFSSGLYEKDQNGEVQGVRQDLHSFLAELTE